MSRAVIGLMEAYLNNNLEAIYLTPDYLVSLRTLFKHIKLVIKTKGYNMTNIELNLVISKTFTGQIVKNSRITYTLKTDKIENITNILGSQSIKAIPSKYYDSELLAGKEWDIKLIKEQTILHPQKTEYYEHSHGRLS